AYVAAESTDLSAWRSYATDILGFEVGSDSNDRLLYPRADENHHRIAVRSGERDDVGYVGWQVANSAALDAAAATLDAAGVAVARGTPEEIADRRVLDMLHFTCPHSGVRMELVVS